MINFRKQAKDKKLTLIKSECSVLHKSFYGAYKFLKKTRSHSDNDAKYLYHLPRFLLLGRRGSGKSSFIANAGLKFILSKKIDLSALENIKSTYLCDWWVTSDAIVLDTNGNFTIYPNEEDKYPILWQLLLKLLRRYKHSQPLAGVLLTIDIEDVLSQSDEQCQNFQEQIQQRLIELNQALKAQLPIYIIMTKCDKLTGFTEFFADLDPLERQQPWAINLPQNNEQSDAAEGSSFSSQFDLFIKHLNQRLIWRLHHEHSLARREKVREFPLQIEKLKPNLDAIVGELLVNLNHQQACHVQGIYFTSSLQPPPHIDQLHTELSQSYALQPYAIANKKTHHQAYFSKNVLTTDIMHATNNLKANGKALDRKKNILRKSGFASLGIILLAAIWFFTYQYRATIDEISSAEHALTNYQLTQVLQTQQNNAHKASLNSLLRLRQATSSLDQHYSSFWTTFLNDSAKSVKNNIQQTYNEALQQQLAPKVNAIIRKQLNNAVTPSDIYALLKSYLLLGEPNKLQQANNKAFLISVLLRYWEKHSPIALTSTQPLQALLKDLFNKNLTALNLDPQIIKQARAKLAKLPKAALAYDIVLNQPSNSYVDLLQTLPQALHSQAEKLFTPSTILLPKIYTLDGYHKIYLPNLANSCQQALQGNWVLGGNFASDDQTTLDQLKSQVNLLYLTDYNHAWNRIASNVHLKQWHNIKQAQQQLQLISQQPSAFIAMLQLITRNTNLDKSSPLMNGLLSQRFALLRHLLTVNPDSNQAPIHTVNTTLSNLAGLLNNLKSTSDPDMLAYNIARQRFVNPSNQDSLQQLNAQAQFLPVPLKNWMTSLSQNSWHLILRKTRSYLNAIWQAEVLPAYDTTIQGNYPVYSSAKSTIKLNDFIHFFAPNGVVDNFYAHYLKAFVNTHPAHWAWAVVDNKTLPISNKVLNQVQRAEIIKQMFFPNNDAKLHIHFTLQSVLFADGISTANLTINGETHQFSAMNHSDLNYDWPGKPGINEVSFNIKDNLGKTYSKTLLGTWAWFRLIDANKLLTTQNPQVFSLQLGLHKLNTKFILQTTHPFNPFIPDVVAGFRCPESL